MGAIETKITDSPAEAAEVIKSGGISAFPTETVYGLGAGVFNENAIRKIFDAKQRPADNPLIAHISSLQQIDELAEEVNENASSLIQRFFPGPLAVVLNKRIEVPGIATAGLDSIGIRMPRNELARQFLKECDRPVVAPSANISGRPSPTTWQAVHEDLDGRIDCILRGDPTEIGLESTVVDCRGNVPIILRLGAVSLEEIRAVVPAARSKEDTENGEVRSPGLRHKHYSPRAKVKLFPTENVSIDGGSNAFIGTITPSHEFAFAKIAANLDEYARELFEFFRECDRRGIEIIYCEEAAGTGIAAALMDRITRASEAGS